MTPDRESVIKRLEKVSYYFKSLLTVGWQGDADIYREHRESVNMAIALLKEQESVKPIRLENWWECPSCSGNIVANMKYCPGCGRKVKWDADD